MTGELSGKRQHFLISLQWAYESLTAPIHTPSSLSTCLTGWEYPVKCRAHGHNKQACRLFFHPIPFVLSAKQGSCEYHFLKLFRVTRLGKWTTGLPGEVHALTTTPSRRCYQLLYIATKIPNLSTANSMPPVFPKKFDLLYSNLESDQELDTNKPTVSPVQLD